MMTGGGRWRGVGGGIGMFDTVMGREGRREG